MLGAKEDFNDSLIMFAIAPNVVGVIGSAVTAVILQATFGKAENREKCKDVVDYVSKNINIQESELWLVQ